MLYMRQIWVVISEQKVCKSKSKYECQVCRAKRSICIQDMYTRYVHGLRSIEDAEHMYTRYVKSNRKKKSLTPPSHKFEARKPLRYLDYFGEFFYGICEPSVVERQDARSRI